MKKKFLQRFNLSYLFDFGGLDSVPKKYSLDSHKILWCNRILVQDIIQKRQKEDVLNGF